MKDKIRTKDDCLHAIWNGYKDAAKWLKDNHYEAYFFGLGFVQVKIDEHHRYHFYHPDLPAFVESPHDHRYSFVSTVCKGNLYSEVWVECQGDEPDKELVEITYESCKKDGGIKEVPPSFPAYVVKDGIFTTQAISSYYMNKDVYHTVKPDFRLGPCITFIERKVPSKEFAKVIKFQNVEESCPFSKVIDETEIWDIVEDCI